MNIGGIMDLIGTFSKVEELVQKFDSPENVQAVNSFIQQAPVILQRLDATAQAALQSLQRIEEILANAHGYPETDTPYYPKGLTYSQPHVELENGNG